MLEEDMKGEGEDMMPIQQKPYIPKIRQIIAKGKSKGQEQN